jgi:hypothetical protein
LGLGLNFNLKIEDISGKSMRLHPTIFPLTPPFLNRVTEDEVRYEEIFAVWTAKIFKKWRGQPLHSILIAEAEIIVVFVVVLIGRRQLQVEVLKSRLELIQYRKLRSTRLLLVLLVLRLRRDQFLILLRVLRGIA